MNNENLKYYDYTNFGDVDFFQHGVYARHRNDDTTYEIICCRPYDDEEDLYQYSENYVDISDGWINRKDIMDYIGMKKEPKTELECIQFAIGCIDYYGADNFRDYNIPTNMTREEVVEELDKHYIFLD